MPGADSRRPQAATCEEWDEDAQAALPGSRTSANVAVQRPQPGVAPESTHEKRQHDGSDSGYSSRTGTVDSEPPSRSKMPDLTVNTHLVERERQPYHHTHSSSESRRNSSTKPKASTAETRPTQVQTYYVHERGACWICDKYGKHIDVEGLSRSSSAQPPPSPKLSRQTSSKPAKDDTAYQPDRRTSATKGARPLSMHSHFPTQVPCIATTAVYSAAMATPMQWATPTSPTVAYSPYAYSYTSTTPISNPYSHIQTASYFDPAQLSASRPPNSKRRSTGYGEPIINHQQASKTSSGVERAESPEKGRPKFDRKKSSRDVDDDRAAMPPPPRPMPPEVILAHRPSMKKSATYNSSAPMYRRSQNIDEYDRDEYQNRVLPRDRQHSPTRPPSSYRAPPQADHTERPHPTRKSVSYSTSPSTTKVAPSSPEQQYPPRRTTIPTSTLEHKEAEAEAYQRKRSSVPTNGLTAEALHKFSRGHGSSLSESGSNHSHKSHLSSSKDSHGRQRGSTTVSAATKTQITIDGGITLSIPSDYDSASNPVKIDMGNFTISMNSKDEDHDSRKGTTPLERAPSASSKTSRRSTTSAVSSGKVREHERESTRESSRRQSVVDDRQHSKRSSRQHSRGPSNARQDADYGQRD